MSTEEIVVHRKPLPMDGSTGVFTTSTAKFHTYVDISHANIIIIIADDDDVVIKND